MDQAAGCSICVGHNPDLFTVTNAGIQPLVISGILLTEGASSFQLTDVPSDINTHPIVLPSGRAFAFGISFSPDKPGLRRALIDVITNDPLHPSQRVGAMGTGIPKDSPSTELLQPQVGADFVAIQVGNALPFRTVTNATGDFSFFLGPQQQYKLTVFDPSTGYVAHSAGMTAASGATRIITSTLGFGASEARDSDFDGLPDDIEFAIGTDAKRADTDGDGIDDFSAIQEGLDPLGGHSFPTGVIASLPLQGEANKVVLEGSTLGTGGQTAYVATGSYGLAIVDASQFNKPTVLSQLRLPGNATDVSVDPNLHVAAVADNSGGLEVVDVSNPTRPKLLQTIPVPASQVQVANGVAYATVGSSLESFDVLTGENLQILTLPGGTLTGLAREGTMLYTMDSNFTLRAVDISGFQMVPRGSLTLSHGGGQLFVGNGIAYVPAADAPRLGGFATVDVSNPDALTLISAGNTTANGFAGTDFAANGSGLGLLVGQPIGPGGVTTNVVEVMDVSDPKNTTNYLTQFNLSVPPVGVAIAAGIGFIADGSGGLQIINYVPFDTKGVPPTVSISLPSSVIVGMNGNTPEVVEGSTLPVLTTASDDVQVRNVELLVKGQVDQNAVSFPFNLSAIAPTISQSGNSFTIQARATDSGGNVGLSKTLTFDLVRDTFAPTIVSMTPADGATLSRGLRRVEVRFSKPLAAATVTTSNFRLRDSSGKIISPLDLRFRSGDRVVELAYDPLPIGNYQLVINGPAVTDRAGNALGTGDVVSSFTLFNVTNSWTNSSGGAWENPANWSRGVVPGPLDDVVITLPGTYQISVNSDLTIASLTLGASSGTQTLSSNHNITLGLTSTIGPNGVLDLSGGTLTIDEDLRGTGEVGFIGGTVNVQGSYDITGTTRVTAGVNFNDMSSTGSLLLSGTLGGTGILNVTGLLSWTAGTMTGTGTTVAASTLTISSNNDKFLDGGRHLDNAGTATWNGGGNLYLRGGSVLTNRAGASFEADNNQVVRWDSGGQGSFINAGTFRKAVGTGTTLFDNVPFSTTGSVDLQTGTLQFNNGGGTLGGTVTTAAGTALALYNSGFSQPAGATLTAAGSVLDNSSGTLAGTVTAAALSLGGSITLSGAVSTPTLTVNGSVGLSGAATLGNVTVGNSLTITSSATLSSLQDVTVSGTLSTAVNASMQSLALGGTLSGVGTVTVAGLLNWTAGTMTGTGTTVAVGPLAISSNNDKFLDGGRHLDNAGTATWNGGGNLYLRGGSVLTNRAGASFEADNNQSVIWDSGTQGSFVNAGTFRKAVGTGTTLFNGVPFSTTGLVDLQTGTVNFSSGFTQTAGSVDLSGGTLSGTLIDIQGGSLSGSGTINASVRNAGQVNPGGSGAGQLTINGNYTQTSSGVLNIDLGGLTPGTQYDQLVVSGTVTLDGTLNITLVNGFTPSTGDTFTILTYSAFTGQFATINGLTIGGGLKFTPNYQAKTFTLTAG
jgi:hypothetical protein